MNAERAKLRWRCRRGTRELDQLLGRWLDDCYEQATPAAREGFARLLDHQDPDLWEWLLGQGAPGDKDEAAIIDEIRSGHRV